MIKTAWLVLLCCGCLLTASGQTIEDLNNTARKFLFSNTDSSIEYGQRGLLLARKTGNIKLEGEAYYLLGGNYWNRHR